MLLPELLVIPSLRVGFRNVTSTVPITAAAAQMKEARVYVALGALPATSLIFRGEATQRATLARPAVSIATAKARM